MTMAHTTTTLDLGVADVHRDAPLGGRPSRTLKPISTPARKRLPDRSFALPETRQYPIHDASHARNAMARLEQNKGRLTPGQYQRAKANILRAYRRFGIKREESRGTRATIRTAGLSIHVRHLNDRGAGERLVTAIELDQALVLDDGEARPVWNQLTKLGQWAGHPSGPFQITQQINAEIVRNFRATTNRRIPIDFEHASESDPTEGTIPTEGAPAQAWILDLDDRGAAGLWGLVEWLEPARTYVKEKKYRFFSPAIRFNSKDRVSAANIGARMTSGALTNNPFLDGMTPLMAATDKSTEPITTLSAYAHSPDEYMPRMRACLDMDIAAPARECMDRVCRLEELYDKACAAGAEIGMVEGVDLPRYMRGMREYIGAAPGSTWEEVFAVVKGLIEAAIGEHNIEEHGGGSPPPSSRDMKDTTMDQETTIKLRDAEATITTLRAEHAAAKGEIVALKASESALTLKLAEATSKTTALETELKTLRDAETKRLGAEQEARVDAVLLTYKDSKGLKPEHRPHLLSFLRADPAGFDAMYPPVPAHQQHLLRTIVRQGNERADRGAEAVQTTAPSGESMRQLTDKFRKSGMQLDDAVAAAEMEIRKREALARHNAAAH